MKTRLVVGLAVVGFMTAVFARQSAEPVGTNRVPYVWVQGPTQAIPNARWTTVRFEKDWTDPDNMWVASAPTRIRAVTPFLYSCVFDGAWEANPNGSRKIRFAQTGAMFPWAQAEYKATGSAKQHTQASIQPGMATNSTLWVQVWQDSGGPLDLVKDGVQAPILMCSFLSVQ